jgi:fructokinase
MSLLLCTGEALVDLLRSKTDGSVLAVPGGGPMNAAIAAARLGVPTAFLGRVSTDAYGQQIWSHLLASNVILDAAQRGPEPTATAEVITEPVQRFVFSGTGTADTCLDAVDLASLPDRPGILHGGTLGLFRGRTAETVAELASGFPGLVSLDPNIRPAMIEDPDRWWHFADRWIGRANLVRGSDEDLEWMEVTIDDLLARGVGAVVRTLGADGAEVALASGAGVRVAGRRIDFVDAVGAGDSFCGALLARLHETGATPDTFGQLDLPWWESTLDFAVGVAGITCSRRGADPPWRHELDGHDIGC